ncbi:pitrilysin family protein [Streptomyces sp. B1I3]|uniref:M16 family metallopeptidase n=1 Tax=Streptomyces sp. B1I3 TaxID=3042264 RepID=UPI00278A1702|nr:pitrilysin family protein [Streptomyces sp. B1I3]MDQ0797262.1 putative Zn-dependent peptidase [Streptomyces sp. B1I3]
MPALNPIGRTLSNGLRVIVSRDTTVPVAAVCLWYRVGSCDEPAGRTGLSHLFEHLMFQGSTHVPANGHTAAVEEAGGLTNASSGFERTTFYTVVPAGQLELVLWLEADRMGGMLDAFTPEGLGNQRDVVLNERRERYDNVPYGTGWEQLVAMTFPPGHPFRELPAGSPRDLAAVTEDDCRAFFRRHYAPDRAILTVVGDVEPDAVVDLAERHFRHIAPSASGRWAPPACSRTPALPAETRRHAEAAVPGPAFMAAYQLPARGGRAYAATDLALTLLGGMSSSGLHDRLVRRDQLAHSARFSLLPLRSAPSLGRLDVRAVPGTGLDVVEKVVDEEIERLVDHGVADASLRGAKAQIRREWYDRLAHPGSRADELCAQEAHFGDAALADAHLGEALDISAAEVRQAAADWLAPERRSVLTYEPAGATDPARAARGAAA